MESEISKTLRAILEYIGADVKYAQDAQLQTYLEWLVEKATQK